MDEIDLAGIDGRAVIFSGSGERALRALLT